MCDIFLMDRVKDIPGRENTALCLVWRGDRTVNRGFEISFHNCYYELVFFEFKQFLEIHEDENRGIT